MIESRKCLEQQSRASGFFAVHAIVVFADDSRVCFILLEKLLVGGTTQGLLFFPFFLFVCPQDDMSTIKQTIMCQYLSLLFSLFSVRLHFMWYSHPFPSPSITPPLRCVPVLCYRGGVLPSDSAPGHENVSVEKRG